MISQVSYPNYLKIKPIKTYPAGSGRKTTITGFNKVLDQEKDKVVENKERKAEKEDTSEEGSKNTGNSTDVTGYRDPVTGKTVRYVDVADNKRDDGKDDGKTVNKPQSSGSSNVIPASSMKKTKYDAYFKVAAKKYNVSESLLKAIAKAESDFNADCVSSAGAIGVMQLMPSTAEGLGVDDPYDPEQNIMGGAKCIAQKLEEFKGNVKLALAAYNAGSGAVKRNGGVPSYCTTYVNKVLAYKEAYETANAVG